MLTAALFTFDAGPENAMEHPVKLHPLRITGGILFPGQLERDEVVWLIVEVVSLDRDTVAELDFSQLDKLLEMSTSCALEVRSYCHRASMVLWPVRCCISFSGTPA